MITMHDNGSEVLRELRTRAGLSQRQIAKMAAHELGYISQASISLMEAGKMAVNPRYEDWLRVKAGERVVPVPPCPDCGSVHHARCHGNGGACVVLGVAQRVVETREPQPAKRPRRLVRPVASAAQNARRQALGDTWREIIEAGLAAREAARQKEEVRE